MYKEASSPSELTVYCTSHLLSPCLMLCVASSWGILRSPPCAAEGKPFNEMLSICRDKTDNLGVSYHSKGLCTFTMFLKGTTSPVAISVQSCCYVCRQRKGRKSKQINNSLLPQSCLVTLNQQKPSKWKHHDIAGAAKLQRRCPCQQGSVSLLDP